jgi:hypothetical protein
MLPPAGSSPAEQWLAEGRRAAAMDMLQKLSSLDKVGPIYLLIAERADMEALNFSGGIPLDNPEVPFVFGHELTQWVEEGGFQHIAYFGGASAPLMTVDQFQDVLGLVLTVERPTAVVNNYHSSDWVVLNHAGSIIPLAEQLQTDNSLGWILDHEAGFEVRSLDPSAATRTDIDTPTDLLLLHRHPDLGSNLGAFLAQAPVSTLARVDRMREVMSTPASALILIGRTSSHAWRTLERETQIWVRVFAEERGMVASGRVARGEVRSLIADFIDTWGAQVFIKRLSELADAVLWDTRVWMAHRGNWPSSADRFAADLGWEDQIEDSALREITRAVNRASIPILTGGYGVVSGGIYASIEVLSGGDYQPSRYGRQS